MASEENIDQSQDTPESGEMEEKITKFHFIYYIFILVCTFGVLILAIDGINPLILLITIGLTLSYLYYEEQIIPAAPIPVVEPVKPIEPAKVIEPVKAPEPVRAPEPIKAPKIVIIPEPMKVAEPAKPPKPIRAPEPVKAPEPVTTPKLMKTVKPTKVPKPIKAPKPIKPPKIVITPEPMKIVEPAKPPPEPVIAPEPVKAPEIVKPLEPVKASEPIKAPEPIIPSVKIPGQVPVEEFEETIPITTDEGILEAEKEIHKGISELEAPEIPEVPEKVDLTPKLDQFRERASEIVKKIQIIKRQLARSEISLADFKSSKVSLEFELQDILKQIAKIKERIEYQELIQKRKTERAYVPSAGTKVLTISKPTGRRRCPKCGNSDKFMIREMIDKENIILDYPRIYGKKFTCGLCGVEWREK